MNLQVGQEAPAFTLYNTEKQPVSLDSFFNRKHVLLLFFPFAFSSTCTAELCAVRDKQTVYQPGNIQVFGISTDSVYALARYRQEQQLNYPLLSDFNKEVSTGYGAIYNTYPSMKLKGVSKRAAFLIDKSGIILYVEVLENANEIPDFEAIDRILAELR